MAAEREPSAEAHMRAAVNHPVHPGSARQFRLGSEQDAHKRGREGEAGTAGEGGLPTSDPADGGHMAAASQIKRLRLGGSAITAV